MEKKSVKAGKIRGLSGHDRARMGKRRVASLLKAYKGYGSYGNSREE